MFEITALLMWGVLMQHVEVRLAYTTFSVYTNIVPARFCCTD